MDTMISAIRGFLDLKDIPFSKRLKYSLDIVRLKSLKPGPSNRISLFGFNINYDRFDSLSVLIREIFIDRLYNCRLKTKSPVIFDIGGNIGIATLFFKLLYPQSIIYSFEPDHDTFSILERNVEENNLRDGFIIRAGLWDFTGRSTFFVPPWSSGSSSLFKEKVLIERSFADKGINEDPFKEKEVDVLRGYEFIREKGIDHIDILKIDAEGAEEKIIRDLSPCLDMIDLIVLEHHYCSDFLHDNSMAKIISYLEGSGFIISVKPLWMAEEPQVAATYLIKALRGKAGYNINALW